MKCHPDKNPDNPKAVELFHQLSNALEILTDAPARAAYDKVRISQGLCYKSLVRIFETFISIQMVKAKKAAAQRHRVLDTKRRKLKEDLEAREKQFAEDQARNVTSNLKPDMTQADRLKAEVDRLRREGSRLVEEEQERLRQEILVSSIICFFFHYYSLIWNINLICH